MFNMFESKSPIDMKKMVHIFWEGIPKREKPKFLMALIVEQMELDKDNLQNQKATLDKCLHEWKWTLDSEEQCNQLFYSTMYGMSERLEREAKYHREFIEAKEKGEVDE